MNEDEKKSEEEKKKEERMKNALEVLLSSIRQLNPEVSKEIEEKLVIFTKCSHELLRFQIKELL